MGPQWTWSPKFRQYVSVCVRLPFDRDNRPELRGRLEPEGHTTTPREEVDHREGLHDRTLPQQTTEYEHMFAVFEPVVRPLREELCAMDAGQRAVRCAL